MTTTAAIRALVGQYPGRFSVELGINVSVARSQEIFKWFLASMLFGARISENVVKRTFRQFASRNVVAPGAILDTGWDGLVEILDQGGYVRYDFKTAGRPALQHAGRKAAQKQGRRCSMISGAPSGIPTCRD